MESEKLYGPEDDKYVQRNKKIIKGIKYLTFFASMLLLLNGSFFDKNIAEHKKKLLTVLSIEI